jgi:hypothetical protein
MRHHPKAHRDRFFAAPAAQNDSSIPRADRRHPEVCQQHHEYDDRNIRPIAHWYGEKCGLGLIRALSPPGLEPSAISITFALARRAAAIFASTVRCVSGKASLGMTKRSSADLTESFWSLTAVNDGEHLNVKSDEKSANHRV